jgi:hypothetical protein
MDSVWQTAAKKKFPGSQIFGDGPFAMRAQCCQAGTVFLYWFHAEVKQAQYESCGHAFCKGQYAHTAYKLQPAQAVPQQFAHSAGYGRD